MTDQPGPARFQALLESAVQAYEKKAGTALADSGNSLAMKLQNCNTVDDVTRLLQDQAQSFNDFRQHDRIFNSIKTIVPILSTISSVASVGDNVGLPLLPYVKATHATLGILLDAADGVVTNSDALADMLESIGQFVGRLRIYTETAHPTPAVDDVVVKTMVELISTLALVAQKLKKRRLPKWQKNFFAVKDINAARRRLERLLQEEDRAVGAETLKAVEDNKATFNLLKRDELLNNIRKWLSPPDPWKKFNIARKSRHSNTGMWFVKGNTFSEWKASGPSSLLWINGKAGAGKTVLCSAIIEEIMAMQQFGDASLSMCYYDFREDQKKDLRGLLASVLFQLCEQSDSYHPILSTFYSTHLNGARTPSDDELIRCLIDLLELPGSRQVYLIVDALDECPSTSSLSSPREALLSLLKDLVEKQLPNLRICVASRPEVYIKTLLEPLAFRSVSLSDESEKDITNYIKSIIGTNKKMENWSSHHKQLVTDVLTRRADGMFRWVYCQLEYLADCPPVGIKRALDELPATLDGTYERVLRELNDRNSECARRLLLCVAVACRPLRVEELAGIIAFDFEGPIPAFREECRPENPVEAVLSTCSTLLSIVKDQDFQVVQFAHFSVKEFLTSTRFAEKQDTISSRYHISMTPAHTVITQACLGMLLHLDHNITADGLTRFPLAEYAAKHLFEHARFEGVSQNVEEGMKQLFDRTKPHLSICLWIHDRTVYHRRRKVTEKPSPLRGTPLHYAVSCGLYDVAKILATEYPNDVNSQGLDNSSTPLHLASGKGHVDIARMLVDRGANMSAQDKHERTPLHLTVSYSGHVDMARMLLSCSADVSAQDKDGRTPLHQAASGIFGVGVAHLLVARMLVDSGADMLAKDKDGRTPLHLAAFRISGGMDVAEMLMERGADVSARDKDKRTPLHLAARSSFGDVKVAQMLAMCGADKSAQDKDGRTPLHLAVFSFGGANMARMLVGLGAKTSAQDKDGRTPLHLAVFSIGGVNIARMLVDLGAKKTAKDKDGRTPVQLASFIGNREVEEVLVNKKKQQYILP